MTGLLSIEALLTPAGTPLAVDVIGGRVRFVPAAPLSAVAAFVSAPRGRAKEPVFMGDSIVGVDLGIPLNAESEVGTAVYCDRAMPGLATTGSLAELIGCVESCPVDKIGGKLRRSATVRVLQMPESVPEPIKPEPAKTEPEPAKKPATGKPRRTPAAR